MAFSRNYSELHLSGNMEKLTFILKQINKNEHTKTLILICQVTVVKSQAGSKGIGGRISSLEITDRLRH